MLQFTKIIFYLYSMKPITLVVIYVQITVICNHFCNLYIGYLYLYMIIYVCACVYKSMIMKAENSPDLQLSRRRRADGVVPKQRWAG